MLFGQRHTLSVVEYFSRRLRSTWLNNGNTWLSIFGLGGRPLSLDFLQSASEQIIKFVNETNSSGMAQSPSKTKTLRNGRLAARSLYQETRTRLPLPLTTIRSFLAWKWFDLLLSWVRRWKAPGPRQFQQRQLDFQVFQNCRLKEPNRHDRSGAKGQSSEDRRRCCTI